MTFNRNPYRARQNGIAPLEMVMSLPFLVGMVAMTASLGWVALYRSMACAEVRHEVWRLRTDPQQSAPELNKKETKTTSPLGPQDFNPFASPLAGEVYGEIEHVLTLYTGFGTAKPQGRAAVLANTWDDRSLDGDFDGGGPHVKILYRMALGIGLGAVSGLGGLRDMKLPNQSEVDAAQGEIDKAEEQTEKLKEEYRKIIDDLKKRYEEVKKERDQLVAERQKLIDERNKLDKEIAELERQIAEQDPPNPALVAELEKKKAERNKLTQEIDQKTAEIQAKEREMAAIQEEIRRHEQAMEDAQEDVEGLP